MKTAMNMYDLAEQLKNIHRNDMAVDLDAWTAHVESHRHHWDGDIERGWFFVYSAVQSGNAKLVERMISLADKKYANEMDFDYGLEEAAKKGWSDVVQLLVPHIYAKGRDISFFAACDHKQIETVTVLLEHGSIENKTLLQALKMINHAGRRVEQETTTISRLIGERLNFDNIAYGEDKFNMGVLSRLGPYVNQLFFENKSSDMCAQAVVDLAYCMGQYTDESNQSLGCAEIMNVLYDKCEDLMLSYTDQQLRVFLKEDEVAEFWAIHRQRQTRRMMEDQTQHAGLKSNSKRM